ncbi:MAG: ATP-dependent RecD-like DNA helicase, partial [Acholeplasmataceae bacterium]
YSFKGTWVTHRKYGEQLQVEAFEKDEEQTELGLISYLSSSFFDGIGPKTAERIVETLGLNAINRILEDHNVLKDVGLGPTRRAKLRQQLIDNQMHERVLVALYGYGLSGRFATRLLDRYGADTVRVVTENPYRLVDEIEGIGFIKADEIAQKVGIRGDDIRRIEAAILHTIEEIAYQRGDLYVSIEQLKEDVLRLLKEELETEEAIASLVDKKRIIVEDGRYYLASSYQVEVELAERLKTLIGSQETYGYRDDLNALLDQVELQNAISYTNVQKEAILTSLTAPISIITGGPGTGKTTIIRGLLEVYRRYNKLSFAKLKEKVALMAPTGRAAKRMSELLEVDAKTIHRQLGFNYEGVFAHDAHNPLLQQLIIIDEFSMVDVFLAHRLFQAIDQRAQVVVVGDVDQLPSVGPGQVLLDLIESQAIAVVRLDEIHRQARDSRIVHLARAVNEQRVEPADLASENDVFLYQCHPKRIKDVVVKQLRGALNRGYSMVDDIQVLAPMYKGDLGIDSFNALLQKTFNPNRSKGIKHRDREFYINDKVIQLVNDPERMVMNGDIGSIKALRVDKDQEAFMVVDFEDNEVIYKREDLDELNLAYAVSIHKSQGSEYRIVMMPMVRTYMHMLKKELIYTAITRAKEYLIILGDMELLTYAANSRSEKRKTTLAMRLSEPTERQDLEDEDELSPYDFM